MKILACILIVALLNAAGSAGEPQKIPIGELDKSFRLVGKLHMPFGQLTTIQGVVLEGPSKGYENGLQLRVQRIAGAATQEAIQILVVPCFLKWGEDLRTTAALVWAKPPDERYVALPNLKVGDTYEMEGYSTGAFVGRPKEAYEKFPENIQSGGYYFQERFMVLRAQRIAQP